MISDDAIKACCMDAIKKVGNEEIKKIRIVHSDDLKIECHLHFSDKRIMKYAVDDENRKIKEIK